MTDPDTKEEEYLAFLEFHAPQMKAMDLPPTLHRRLFNKVKFADFDIGEKVQIVVDEDDEKVYLRAIHDLEKHQDVFLVDHAWTFKHRTAYENLTTNEKLLERVENIMRFPAKQDMPGESPYAKKRPSLEEYLKQCEESKEPVLSYDLDEYEIEDLTNIKFRPEVEEISLFNNKIDKPTNITEVLMKLPNLKALWLNGNPVEQNCANFNIIGNHFDKLEIFNSALTVKAGEWAVMFYAKNTGAKSLEEITYLDISGKNLLMVDDLEFLSRLKNIKVLDISDNIDMYKPTAMLKAEAKKKEEGSGHTNVDFMDNKHHRDQILDRIPSVEHIICDVMLEMYIIEMKEKKDFLPNLKTMNRLPLSLKTLGERGTKKRVLKALDNLWMYVGTYRLVKPGVMDEEPCFYMPDEVGTALSHSDTPNVRMMPFIYSPNCKHDDAASMTYSLVWPLEKIQKQGFLMRDFLAGITEDEFRSARMYPWFNVYEEYFQEEYEKFANRKLDFDAKKVHEELQTSYPAQSTIDWDVQ
jgi:tubulin--tyrosine ligase-like protein 12